MIYWVCVAWLCALLSWGIVSAVVFVTKDEPQSKIEVSGMHFVYGELFTISDPDKKEWFYNE